ncbi:hypothetical protein PTI98_012267 [Pleurotus ostreatus]|nr:hypothetical protein PTI98_012267 [Pleurotus ostreatus]
MMLRICVYFNQKCWEAGKERSGKVALSKPTADLNKVDTNAQCSKEPSMSAPLTGNVKEQTLK